MPLFGPPQEACLRIVILGVNHQIQRPFGSSRKKDREFVQNQKEHFAQLLREHIQKNEITFVGEEANHAEESIAKWVCDEESCIYANIEMTAEERARHNIPTQYNESDTLSDAEKARGNRERESHMVSQILINAGDSRNILVICGDKHSDALADQFRGAGHSVEIDDLRNHSWYVEDWMEHMLYDF